MVGEEGAGRGRKWEVGEVEKIGAGGVWRFVVGGGGRVVRR